MLTLQLNSAQVTEQMGADFVCLYFFEIKRFHLSPVLVTPVLVTQSHGIFRNVGHAQNYL